jgi:protein-disulfide isomerase
VEGHNTNEIRNKYEWKGNVRERLREYHKSMDTLPCGHRAHVYNTSNGYSCKYCKEINGELPTWDKDTLQQCL